MITPQQNDSKGDRYRRSSSVDYIAARWCMLPPHIRETIVTLVDAGLQMHQQPASQSDFDTKGNP